MRKVLKGVSAVSWTPYLRSLMRSMLTLSFQRFLRLGEMVDTANAIKMKNLSFKKNSEVTVVPEENLPLFRKLFVLNEIY